MQHDQELQRTILDRYEVSQHKKRFLQDRICLLEQRQILLEQRQILLEQRKEMLFHVQECQRRVQRVALTLADVVMNNQSQ